MKHLFLATLLLILSARANDLDAIQGKWTLKKTGDNGPVTHLLEFKKEKLIFKRVTEGGESVAAEAEIQVKKVGAFSTLHLRKIKYGPSENELTEIDDERDMPFRLHDGKLYLATNLDREQDDERPTLDVYSKSVEPAKPSNQLVGSWKLNLELGETTYDYTLRIAESAGKLSATQVSPRSGEHKVRTITFENNAFKMEIDREIENSPVTFVYTGKLEGQTLSGSAAAKRDGEEIAAGSWTAKK